MTIGNESYPHLKFNSTTYIAFCTIKDHHHMKQMMFSVMDDAMSSPVNATATIFVIKPPTFQFAMKEILRDGEAFNITCMLDGGRPNPNVYFNISGSEISSAKTHFYNSTSSLHTNIITLTSFKKEWNKENITCCRYNEWYKISRKCSPPKQVKYLSNQDGLETGDNTCTKGKNKNGAGVEAIVGSVVAALAVGSLIGVICTMFFLTRKGLLKSNGWKKRKPPQPTVSSETEFTEPASTLQSQYDSLDQGAEKCHTYTDLKHSR
ncbi:uncharacterized protein LOC132751026 [Ruditapes philippinarum]|uniref:uncharacterized protein LOC132751026 n=1 Tax=Ruditapes philippinarum TaxID=129788 RepID=UPI00295BC9EE|nr:uncharacterized protein LOC132751026 [Ruditapes philippinarum]